METITLFLRVNAPEGYTLSAEDFYHPVHHKVTLVAGLVHNVADLTGLLLNCRSSNILNAQRQNIGSMYKLHSPCPDLTVGFL